MTPELALFLTALGALAGFLLGWDMAVHNHERTKKLLAARITDLEHDAATFRAEQEMDPQRAWIDAGKRNVLAQMEATIRSIRAVLDPER